ncbi:MAG TPA: S8 family peptidase [Thermoanaerobaculia bacterium]|nr:S8 family peptidase [Thermoanaerobaculia bacterium]
MAEIPAYVIEYFLLGRTQRDATERYTQDGGIVSDVWLAFAADRSAPQRVLVAPSQETSAVLLGHALHRAILDYRQSIQVIAFRKSPGVSPLENFVAVTLYFDELLRIVLPLTAWWHRKHLSALRRKAANFGPLLEMKLERAILNKLGHKEGEIELRQNLSTSDDPIVDRRVIEAAPLAALIGLFQVADRHPEYIEELRGLEPHRPPDLHRFVEWIDRHAEDIARASREELARQFDPWLPAQGDSVYAMNGQQIPEPEDPPELIERVFLDRKASLADSDANCTVKADAATRVFDVSCRGITWAIIDSGIATTHPAFLDHDARDRRGRPIDPPPTRIRATLDFTRIERIKNFDLISFPEGSAERSAAIADVVTDLENLPGRAFDPNFRDQATRNIESIARQLEQRLPPDWNLIEPLIRLGDQDDGAQLISDHGTHVAGILAADWRSREKPDGQQMRLLQGVCPDIGLYDLRVIDRISSQSTEFALLAALEYVQFVNARAANNGPLIHGVNVSLSIPHDVRNYGCGATPVCLACDRLVNTGVVVVAAAGNRGWNELEMGFGNFVFCSITDPGNARDIITVGSTHRLKPHMFGVSYFSSRGPTGDGRVKPDLVAPGEKIRGPIRGNADDEMDGTSMAAPFVSGAAAMLIARNRELIGNPARIKQILCDTATDLGREKYFQGHGLVDVLRAMQSL